jgi:hypothetical protein
VTKLLFKNDPLDARTYCQIDHPSDGLYLHSSNFRLLAESRVDLCQSRRMDAGWQVTKLVEWWDHPVS